MESTQEYLDLGIDRETGAWKGPPKLDAEKFWKSSRFYFSGHPTGHGHCIRIVDRVDRIANKDSYTFHEAPNGAPIFGYREANEIRRRISAGGRPIDHFVDVCGTSKVSPEWLRANGYNGEIAVTAPKVDEKQVTEKAQNDLIKRIKDRGGVIPEDLAEELGIHVDHDEDEDLFEDTIDITDLK